MYPTNSNRTLVLRQKRLPCGKITALLQPLLSNSGSMQKATMLLNSTSPLIRRRKHPLYREKPGQNRRFDRVFFRDGGLYEQMTGVLADSQTPDYAQ
jgi:hypothetical protein